MAKITIIFQMPILQCYLSSNIQQHEVTTPYMAMLPPITSKKMFTQVV